ncbi:MAG: DNA/RNA non-specific endonuclease [Rhizonema sp. PD37]|nr:DNA/RNA non-specific endonuclease [Rhizonema sp. PD37]
MKNFLIFLISLVGACLLVLTLSPSFAQTNVHLTMGNPSNAATFNNTNYLLAKSQYVLSYNCNKGISNWASWQLNRSWLGNAARQNNFRSDTSLPSGCNQVTDSNYSGSGFDRGHMTPSADRSNSTTNNSATFLMTNIIPQAPDSNQGVWADLEDYSRDLVQKGGKELYIMSGGYGVGGSGSKGTASTIASGKVTVPNRTWKIIVVLDRPGNASSVTNATRVIAVDIPNTQGIRNNNWKTYRVSVDSIEKKTGYDFLTNVPTKIQSVIEAKVDNQ